MIRYLGCMAILFGSLTMLTVPSVASPAPSHLYVAGNNQIVEYPIRTDGLPATKPDNVLYLDGQSFGLALDSADNLYVTVDPSPSGYGVVEVFPHGAKGHQRPARTISFGPSPEPVYVALDAFDHLYVDLNNNSINVYDQSNSLKLIATIPVPYYIDGMVFDRSGALYVSEVEQVGVYLQPLIRQTPDGLVLPQGGFEVGILGAIAIDETSRRLYFETTPHIEQYWGNFDFATRKLPGYGIESAGNADPMIESGVCYGADGSPGRSYGAAVSGRYFIAGCYAGYVLVYDKTKFGRQHPVEAFSYAGGDIVVGP